MPHHALIWDLDGTLFDSYPAIVPSAQEICAELGLHYSTEYVYDYVIQSSVGALIEQAAAACGLDPVPLKARFTRLSDSRIDRICAMPHAAETLAALQAAGHRHFVYTHRAQSSFAILEQLRLAPYFTEVLTADSGFPRKPAPDAILYLMQKYALRSEDCFYVGDRSLDIEAASRAGIRSILYLSPASPGKPTGREDYLVRDLKEILLLPEFALQAKREKP